MRRQFRSEPAERERVTRRPTAVLEAAPDLEFAWLHGSFLATSEFHGIDVGVHLDATSEEWFRRGLDLAVRLGREAAFPVDVRVLNDAPVTFLFHVFREGRLPLSRNGERLAGLMERTVREYLDMEPLLRRATIEAHPKFVTYICKSFIISKFYVRYFFFWHYIAFRILGCLPNRINNLRARRAGVAHQLTNLS